MDGWRVCFMGVEVGKGEGARFKEWVYKWICCH